MEEKLEPLYKCRCKDCKFKDLCGLLTNQYCPYYNCEVPGSSEW